MVWMFSSRWLFPKLREIMNLSEEKLKVIGRRPDWNGNNMLDEIKEQLRKYYGDTYIEWKQDNFNLNHLFFGKSLLHFAAEEDAVNVAKCLIQNGADVDVKDYVKNKPLSYAALYGNIAIMSILIEKGANVNAKGLFETPLYTVIENVSADLRISMMKLLIENKADIEALSVTEQRPLHVAAKADDGVDVVRLLIENGAMIDCLDMGKNTPLHYAACFNKSDVVQVLVENGASINAFNGDGDTPLHLAVLENDLEIVKCLVTMGADINAKYIGHKTPLDLGREHGYYEIVKYFEEKINYNPLRGR